MKKLILLALFILILPITLGFTYIDHNPGYYDREVLWMESNSSYSFKMPSYYRNLDTVEMEFVGECENVWFNVYDSNIDSTIYSSIISNGNNTFSVNYKESKGKELLFIINNSESDKVTFIEDDYENSLFYNLTIDPSITEKEFIYDNSTEQKAFGHYETTKLPINCGIVSSKNNNSLFILFNESFIPLLKVDYNVSGISKLRDDITFHHYTFGFFKHLNYSPGLIGKLINFFKINKITFTIYLILTIFFVVGLFYLKPKKITEITFIIVLTYYIVLTIIEFFISIEHIRMLPMLIILGLAYLFFNYKKLLKVIKK